MSKKKKKEKILLVSHEMSYTGAPRSLLNIAKVLRNSEIEVTVWSLKGGDFQKEFEKEKIPVQIIGNIEDYVCEITKYDLAILNTIFTAKLVKYFQERVRTILYIREAENISLLVRDCKISMEDIRSAKEALCVSEYAEKYIIAHCNPRSLTVIRNYVKDEYDGSLNIVRNGRIHYLLSGTYEWRKGYDRAIAAFLSMPEKLKKITYLHIVGRKPEWARRYWETLEKSYDDRIIDHGEIADEEKRIALYRKMNVFVIASLDESCSLVALEGAMLGKALIMSENVGAQYLDVKKKGIYPTDDVAMLCRKMCELTSRRELLIRGIEMRRMYKKTSTEKIYVEKLWKIINGGAVK
ncbi:glycosyltransferase family 4 protein [Blautia sp. An46]|uniref:glycosyltransferase family 4 protein n=1 Tax=Blautia sp. An46 TaxID=1965636 RepID=UPI000B37033A|nr:glycosyltransferase family 4 protein [Blautia sp. An46]OUN94047.1 hypothetical protein B5G00_04080 [Blautia sp. An46]